MTDDEAGGEWDYVRYGSIFMASKSLREVLEQIRWGGHARDMVVSEVMPLEFFHHDWLNIGHSRLAAYTCFAAANFPGYSGPDQPHPATIYLLRRRTDA